MTQIPTRTALITGAGSASGIGFATALALGRAGCRVALTSTTDRIHERVRALSAMGLSATGHVADLTVAEQVARLADEVGPVDVLVNNAGMAVLGSIDAQLPLQDIPLALWHTVLERNLTTAFLVTRACLPPMLRRGWGRIVNVSSTTGAVAGVARDSAYAAAKAAMLGMTRSLCLEVARAGITVNAVAPGFTETDMLMGVRSDVREKLLAQIPLHRFGRPEEVAHAVMYALENGYVTGTQIDVNGGVYM